MSTPRTIRQWKANNSPGKPWITCGDGDSSGDIGFEVECYENEAGNKICGLAIFRNGKFVHSYGWIPAEVIETELK
jgi:hypothetical protein